MPENTKSPRVNVRLEIIQVEKEQKYKGTIQIGELQTKYSVESRIPTDKAEEENFLKRKTFLQKVLFQIKITSCGGMSLGQEDAEFIFFYNLLCPNIRRSCYELEMVRFNEMDKAGRKACIRARESSIGRPINMIIIPHKIYIFQIQKGDIPETILEFV